VGARPTRAACATLWVGASSIHKNHFKGERRHGWIFTPPAKIINRAPKIGTLQVGAPADVAIMDLVEGPVSFVDTRNNKRDGKALLKPVQTVINGVPFGRPYQAPFAVK
jgi:hypothetical protein